MKFKLSLLIILFTFSTNYSFSISKVNIAKPENEIYVGYGVQSLIQIVDEKINDTIAIAHNRDGNLKNVDNSVVGTFNLGYNYNVGTDWTLGLELSHFSSSNTENYTDKPSFNYTLSFTSILLRVDYRYYQTETMQLYSGIALGKCYINISKLEEFSESSKYSPTSWQLNIIGCRIGKDLAGFGEFGVGFASILHLGVSYKF